MCFKGNCDVTNKAERLSTVKSSKEGWGGGLGMGVMGVGWVDWVLVWRRKVRGGRRHGNQPWC